MVDPITSLQDLGQIAVPQSETAMAQPQIDAYGRAYATGKRKDAVARVWIKPGRGEIKVNGRDITTFFARPTLRMVINQPFVVAGRTDQYDVVCTVSAWLALAMIVAALLAVGFIAGRMTAEAAERQAATCIEGCK